jgi:hypothetical protein
VGGVIEKSKIFGADFPSMVIMVQCRWREAVSLKLNQFFAGRQNRMITLLYRQLRSKWHIRPFWNVVPSSWSLPRSSTLSTCSFIQPRFAIRFSIPLPLRHDRLQFVLLNLFGQSERAVSTRPHQTARSYSISRAAFVAIG